MSSRMGWARDPLTIFGLFGLAIYAYAAAIAPDARPVIALSEDMQAVMVEDFETLTGRLPDAVDLARLERDYLTDELLFREALAQKLHLKHGEVRATLIEAMRYQLTGVMTEPGPEDLVNYYADHLERYRSEPTMSFEHVFFEDAAPQDALQTIAGGDVLVGDTFIHGRNFPDYGHSMLRGLFGHAFVESMIQLPESQWVGPIMSDLGTHFVFIHEQRSGEPLSFGAVRRQVEQDYRQSRIDMAIQTAVSRLEADYEIQRAP
ncbi:MAG: peptidylprolyl isomerase [Pseudomonadota bacterium]